MVKKQEHSTARLIGFLNCRYYVIEMNHRFYIMDYANPRDIRTYFPGFFPKYNRQYTVYDVTANRDQYEVKSVPWWQSDFRNFIESWFVVGLLVIAAVTSHLKIEWLYNQSVPSFWKIILLMYVIGAIGLVFWLNSSVTIPSRLSEEKSYKCERQAQPRYVSAKYKVRTGSVGDFMLTLIGQPLSLVFMLNYSYIVIPLGFILGYSILFIRFLNLHEMLSTNKLIFLED